LVDIRRLLTMDDGEWALLLENERLSNSMVRMGYR
jgi:hypothetical protein